MVDFVEKKSYNDNNLEEGDNLDNYLGSLDEGIIAENTYQLFFKAVKDAADAPQKSYTLESDVHDIRNHLSVMFATVFLMEGEVKLPEPYEKLINSIHKHCDSISRILDNFQSRSRSSSSELNYRNIEVVSATSEILQSLTPLAQKKNIRIGLTTEFPEKVLSVDVYLLERIISNLISNAVKFSYENGEIEVMIKSKGMYIEFSVKDNGIGVDEADLPLIFNRYHHLEGELNPSGSGIGLHNVKEFVSSLKGSVYARNNENGKGLCVSFTLPCFALSDTQEKLII